MKAVILMGSTADEPWANRITERLSELGIAWEQHACSAHKQPKLVLDVLERYASAKHIVYVTIAGRSNALSGFVAANSSFPTLACPPFADRTDMLVNIHSTLQMPSQTPVLTILDPGKCAEAVARILAFGARGED